MHFQLSVISQLMREVPRKVFNNAVVGRSKWGLTEWSHLVTLVAAQLAGMRSLRDLVGMIGQHQAALVHLQVGQVRRTTLSDANAVRPTAPFEAVAAHLSAMVAKLSPGLGREALRLIDATRIHAGQCVREWAVDGAIKLHVVFDPVQGRTTCFGVTSSRVNDITMAKAFPVEHGATYVFDLGYYAFAFWAKLNACRMPLRHSAQDQHAGARVAQPARSQGGQAYPQGSDRLPAATAEQHAPQPL
jgi:putative transposase